MTSVPRFYDDQSQALSKGLAGPDDIPTGDQLLASREFREVLRCSRGAQIRIYGLRIVPGGAELWRVTQTAGEAAVCLKESDLKSSKEAAETFQEIGMALRAAGWREVDD